MPVKRPIEPNPVFQMLADNLVVDFEYDKDSDEELFFGRSRLICSDDAWDDVVEGCYALLNKHFPAWNYNYGAYGKITFNVETQRVTIDIVTRDPKTKTI